MVESKGPDTEVKVFSFSEDFNRFLIKLFVLQLPYDLRHIKHVTIEDVFVLQIVVNFFIAS